MDKFLNSNETFYRLMRTILQGVLGVIVANLDLIIGYGHFSPDVKALIVAIVMAILSPVMSLLGAHISPVDEEEEDDEDEPDDFEEDYNEDQQALAEDLVVQLAED